MRKRCVCQGAAAVVAALLVLQRLGRGRSPGRHGGGWGHGGGDLRRRGSFVHSVPVYYGGMSYQQ